MVLFNRFYSPDIDINKMEITSTNVFSSPEELPTSLRWMALMSGKVKCNLAASTGIHNGEAVIKQLLAGADVVQVASALYKNGIEYLKVMKKELTSWMEEKGYSGIDEFKGKLSQGKISNPEIYERVQFMKYFSDRED